MYYAAFCCFGIKFQDRKQNSKHNNFLYILLRFSVLKFFTVALVLCLALFLTVFRKNMSYFASLPYYFTHDYSTIHKLSTTEKLNTIAKYSGSLPNPEKTPWDSNFVKNLDNTLFSFTLALLCQITQFEFSTVLNIMVGMTSKSGSRYYFCWALNYYKLPHKVSSSVQPSAYHLKYSKHEFIRYVGRFGNPH